MRISSSAHRSRPWRIHEIVADFTLEDVWALPVHGGAEDFPELLERLTSLDPAASDSRAARALWRLRDLLGQWFDLGRISGDANEAPGDLPIPGTDETSLAGRLPDDLRASAADVDFGSVPVSPLYLTHDEFAAEISNRTVHGVMHLAWVEEGAGRHRAQMAVYVKPRGPLGHAYMALIRPFRHLIVYPALMRQIEAVALRR
ncbi:MAG: hypothetical protein QOE65_1957 [Solirubrobacteraceae bacterium]|jgi:hypothetical protein|nr:hypothetical protein [Solirubrobacteraceae bacterium]